jgi:predicted DNA-binding mobile mystery protein A
MDAKSRWLAIRQLDQALARDKSSSHARRPRGGWIHAIRKALGMSGRQLGKRAGMTQEAVAKIERGERQGTLTMATMEKMARALDCTFVYAFVPNTTLADFLKTNAEALARRRITGVSHSMALESQDTDERETREQIAALANEILATMPRYIWDLDAD